MAVNPSEPGLRLALIGFYADAKALDRAEPQYLELLRIDPKNVGYSVGLARLYLAMGHPDRGERFLRDALTVDPTDERRYMMLADFLVANRTTFKKRLKVNPFSRAWKRRGTSLPRADFRTSRSASRAPGGAR